MRPEARRPLASVAEAPSRLPHDFVTRQLNASDWWQRGVTGRGLRVAIFDTGLPPEHRYVRNVADAVNFCEEQTTEDRVGHSSFMAGVIASHDDCRGFAPDASLYFVRVFDSSQAPRRYPPLCLASLSRAAPRRRRRRRRLRRRSAWPPPPLPGPAAATIAATISC